MRKNSANVEYAKFGRMRVLGYLRGNAGKCERHDSYQPCSHMGDSIKKLQAEFSMQRDERSGDCAHEKPKISGK